MMQKSSNTCRTGESSAYVPFTSLFLSLFHLYNKPQSISLPAQHIPSSSPHFPLQNYSKFDYSIQYDPLVQPALLLHEVTSSTNAKKTIAAARYNAARILAGQDDRLLVVVGPCSIHSPEQAMEYAQRLKAKLADWPHLVIIMRAYLWVIQFYSTLIVVVDGCGSRTSCADLIYS